MTATRSLCRLVCATAIVTLLAAPTQALAAERCFGKRPTIVGNARNNRIVGTNGPDVILAGRGFDRIEGRGGGDLICAGSHSDLIAPGPGNDLVDGQTGSDRLDLSSSMQPVALDLVAGTASGQGTDQLRSIENAFGSDFDDVLEGDDGRNEFEGGKGDDQLNGAAGRDFLLGGSTRRGTALFQCRSDSGADEIQGGAGSDLLEGCDGDDQLSGEGGHDVLVGGYGDFSSVNAFPPPRQGCESPNSGHDELSGGPGRDRLVGCDGDDIMDGGEDVDLASFAGAPDTVIASLLDGSATGDGNDVLSTIEGLSGSDHNDILTGDDGENLLSGGGIELFPPSTGEGDMARGDDQLFAMGGSDELLGGNGSDLVDGGAGRDIGHFNYDYNINNPQSRVTVNLGEGTATGAGTDGLVSIEDAVVASPFASATLIGSPENNRLVGASNIDRISGREGDDVLIGGHGRDMIEGEQGDDLLQGGPLRDSLNGGPNLDICVGGFDHFVDCEIISFE